MEAVQKFINDGVANSENFSVSADTENPNGAVIEISGYYNFHISFNEPYPFSRGEGCSSTSKAIKKILEKANNTRSASQKLQAEGIREALIALRDAYLEQADALDQEAMEEEGGGDDNDGNDDDDAADHDAEAEAMRKEIERQKKAELDAMTPEQKMRKQLVETYLKELQETGQTNTGMSQASTLRLLNDLARVRSTDKPERGWSCEMEKGSLKNWIVKITQFDKGTSLDSEMESWAKKHHKEKAIVLEMTMDREYPYRPPFVRVLRPQFVQYTAHVTLGGSICMLPLTDEGWNPSFDIEAIIEMCRANICDKESKAKVILERGDDYSLAEAREAFQRLVTTHGWKHKF